MNKFLLASAKLALFASVAVSVAWAKSPLAVDDTKPANMRILGPETYETMTLQRLVNPQVVFVDLDMAKADGFEINANGLTAEGLKDFLDHYGYAGKLKGESDSLFIPGVIVVYVGGYGGNGVGNNLGDGRSVILGKYRNKGGARTMKVLEKKDHSNGSASLSEGIIESIAGNLLNFEMPYGAYRSLGVVTTGSVVDGGVRAMIIAEDPVRFAHYLRNIRAWELGGKIKSADDTRVDAAMGRIVEALPKPRGLDLQGKSRQDRFLIGLNEAMDRQAIQFAYAWAHKVYHGATSPSNVALDGRMIDFGTLSAFTGYAPVQILRYDGPSGNPGIYQEDFVEPFWKSLKKNLPDDLKAVLPTQKEFVNRFLARFEGRKRTELVRMAGVFNEIQDDFLQRPESVNLGEILYGIAMAGFKKTVELWHAPMEETEIPAGTYNVEKILNALAGADLTSANALSQAIAGLLPDENLRNKLVSAYQRVFQTQRDLISQYGVSSAAETEYRKVAALMRNTPYYLLMRSKENLDEIKQVVENFEKTGDARPVQALIQSRVDQSRREFRDTPAFTIVASEQRLENGDRVRTVFDARTNSYRRVKIPLQRKGGAKSHQLQKCELLLKQAA